MWFGFLLGIVLYSLLLTVFVFYKDNSGYFIVNELDVILAGPVAWLICLLLFLFSPVIKKFFSSRVKKPKVFSKSKIKKTVKKVMFYYQKSAAHYSDPDYFDLSSHSGHFYGMISGWDDLLIKNWKRDELNKQFTSMMWNQKEEVMEELLPYFRTLSDEEINELFSYDANDIRRWGIKVVVLSLEDKK